MDALRREYYQSKGIVKSIEGDNLDMYKPLLKEAFVENVGSVERLIIESDEEWANLTQVQKNFILKHEEVMRRIFLEKDAYINKTASYDVNNKPKSHLKLQSPDFIYYPGFFAKTQPSKLDLQRRMGNGSVSAALLNPKYHKSMLADTLSFNLHVGADADSTNKITVDIDAMSSAGLGIKGINVSTEQSATYSIDAIADAISQVSSQRSALGAVQNRLEHTINNLDNVVENTTTAESRIRDTDMAEEMVNYSKNNILAQAGQSMLAQANQSNQGVLSLLQ